MAKAVPPESQSGSSSSLSLKSDDLESNLLSAPKGSGLCPPKALLGCQRSLRCEENMLCAVAGSAGGVGISARSDKGVEMDLTRLIEKERGSLIVSEGLGTSQLAASLGEAQEMS